MSKPCAELDHPRDVGGIVLQVAVGGHDEPAARVREPGGEGRCLAEVAPEPDHPQARVPRLQPGKQIERLVRAPIVDDDDLVAAPEGLERRRKLVVQQLGRWVPRCAPE